MTARKLHDVSAVTDLSIRIEAHRMNQPVGEPDVQADLVEFGKPVLHGAVLAVRH